MPWVNGSQRYGVWCGLVQERISQAGVKGYQSGWHDRRAVGSFWSPRLGLVSGRSHSRFQLYITVIIGPWRGVDFGVGSGGSLMVQRRHAGGSLADCLSR
jgi:hypothetical protein